MTKLNAQLKVWTLEIAGTPYSAEALSSVPWVTLKNLAAEKTKLSDFQQQALEQKSLIWARERDILKAINHDEAQTKTGICLSVRA